MMLVCVLFWPKPKRVAVGLFSLHAKQDSLARSTQTIPIGTGLLMVGRSQSNMCKGHPEGRDNRAR